MPTECSADLFGFAPVEGREVVAAFDGGAITSDAGALLLGAADRAIKLTERLAACFHDVRRQELIEHEVVTLVGAAGVWDRARLRGSQRPRRIAPRSRDGGFGGQVGSKTRRLRTGRRQVDAEPAGAEPVGGDALSQDQPQSDCHQAADGRPVPGRASACAERDRSRSGCDRRSGARGAGGRFFNAYYDCYCYLPLYVFCGRHLLAAKLRPASIDAAAGAVAEVARIVAQIRDRWPNVRIVLRADSGFAREELMAWCEANAVQFLFGLQQNERLVAEVAGELARAEVTEPAGWQAGTVVQGVHV